MFSHISRIIKHIARGTSKSRAILFAFIIFPLLLVLIVKGLNILLPFTYLAL